jgi:hypothetical protein
MLQLNQRRGKRCAHALLSELKLRPLMEEAVEHCLIHNTLLNSAKIFLDVESLATVTT